jgi:hypothetical protein
LSSSFAKVCLLALMLAVTLLGVVTLPAFFLVAMVLGAPGAVERPATVLLAFSGVAMPLSCFGAVAGAWKAYRRDEIGEAFRAFWIPAALLAVAGAACAWIEFMQDGQFNG